MKETFDMLELTKIKNLLCEKTTSREREDKLWVGRKYFQNTSDKGLLSKIYQKNPS